MLFSRDKDDDDDFIPNPNYHSNLASIFGNRGNDGNPSLTYTAPKQPKRQSKGNTNTTTQPATSSSTSSLSSVIIAKTVQTFKMVDGSYQNEGRLGVAVISLGPEESCTYQLLLYRDKRHHLCSNVITKDFNFHIQPKNYCTFYDKHAVVWSILFESPSDMIEFNMQVGVAKWKAKDKVVPLLSHDLWSPLVEGPKASAAALGDTVELCLSVHNILNISQALEDELTISTKVEPEGWKAALVGMLPNCKRAIIMQKYMLDKETYPKKESYNSPIVLKIEAMKISKHCREETTEHKNEPVVKTKREDQTRSKETEGQQASPRGSPKPTKADLITRMARMGQALPFKTAAPTLSDSDETEEDQSARARCVNTDRAVPRARTRVQHTPAVGPSPLATPVPVSATVTQQLPAVPWSQAPYMMSNMFIPPTHQLQSPGVDFQSQFHVFLSEMRTTNSELRMGITRLTDKVETLQTKVENQNSNKSLPGNPDLSTLMEKMLDNEKQVQLILSAVNSAQLTGQSKPSGESGSPTDCNPSAPSQPCQKCASQEQSFTSLEAQLKELQAKNEHLQTTNTAQKDAIQNAKIADKDQVERMGVLEAQLGEVRERLVVVQGERDTAVGEVAELRRTVLDKQTTIDRLEQALQESEATKLEEVRRNLQEVLDPKPFIGDHLKKILNVVYRMVKVQFEPQKHYDAAFIQSVLAETIKGVTLEYLENGSLSLTEGQQEKAARSQSPLQTQSAPTVTSQQEKFEEMNGQEEHSSMNEEARLTLSAEVKREVELTTPQQESEQSLYADSVSMQDINGEKAASLSLEADQKPDVSATASTTDSVDGSSDDAWRPQPPPPPLFDEEENDDDWLNS